MAASASTFDPPAYMLNQLYKNLCNNLSKSVLKKLRDASTLKSNISNPHNRQVQIFNVSRLIFSGVYGKLFLLEEKTKKVTANVKNSPLFEVKTMDRLYSVFGSDCLLKIHHGGDVSLITSWLVLSSPIELTSGENELTVIHPGRLLIPLQENDSFIKVFIPCGGPDPDTDKVPIWCKQYPIHELISAQGT